MGKEESDLLQHYGFFGRRGLGYAGRSSVSDVSKCVRCFHRQQVFSHNVSMGMATAGITEADGGEPASRQTMEP